MDAKSQWKRIMQEGTAGEAREFVDQIRMSGHGTVRTKQLTDETIDDEERVWMSWHEAVGKEGEPQLRRMLKNNTI